MKKDSIKEFYLPKFLKGKSFADAAKTIEKKFEDRNDKASLETKEELLGRLAQAQEASKPPMPETNQHALGAMTRAAQSVGAVSAGLSASGALTAGAGLLGPLGIGAAAIPLAYSLATAKDRKDHEYMMNVDATQGGYADLRSDFKYGGKTNDYPSGGFMAMLPMLTQALSVLPGAKVDAQIMPMTQVGSVSPELTKVGPLSAPKPTTGKPNNISGKFDKEKAADAIAKGLRFAPVVSNLMQKSQINPAVTPRGNRSAAQYDENPVDINLLTNRVNSQNIAGAIAEGSGGDLGAYRTNLLAGNANKIKGLSDATLQADGINRGDRQFGFSNRLRRDLMNTQLDERYLNRRAQDIGAYNAAQSQFTSASAQDMGAIGKEMLQKELMKRIFGYGWQGDYKKQS